MPAALQFHFGVMRNEFGNSVTRGSVLGLGRFARRCLALCFARHQFHVAAPLLKPEPQGRLTIFAGSEALEEASQLISVPKCSTRERTILSSGRRRSHARILTGSKAELDEHGCHRCALVRFPLLTPDHLPVSTDSRAMIGEKKRSYTPDVIEHQGKTSRMHKSLNAVSFPLWREPASWARDNIVWGALMPVTPALVVCSRNHDIDRAVIKAPLWITSPHCLLSLSSQFISPEQLAR